MSGLGTWDVTWEECGECPAPVIDGQKHDHSGELIDAVPMLPVEETPDQAW